MSNLMRRAFTATSSYTYTISSNATDVNLRTAAVAAGWDGVRALTVVVAANVGASSPATYALTISGSFPGGVTLVVNSGRYVVGSGGLAGVGGSDWWDGSNWQVDPAHSAGGAGGDAIYATTAVSIQNLGTIAGGGGGGGGNDSPGVGGGTYGSGDGAGYVTRGGATLTTGYASGVTAGGNLGMAGANGSLAGGAAGRYMTGNTNVTWLATGARLGSFS